MPGCQLGRNLENKKEERCAAEKTIFIQDLTGDVFLLVGFEAADGSSSKHGGCVWLVVRNAKSGAVSVSVSLVTSGDQGKEDKEDDGGGGRRWEGDEGRG